MLRPCCAITQTHDIGGFNKRSSIGVEIGVIIGRTIGVVAECATGHPYNISMYGDAVVGLIGEYLHSGRQIRLTPF